MGRAPCCDKANVKKGPWSPEEDAKLKAFIEEHGTGGNWIALPHKIGLKRCGKSCRLRWLNYLRPNIKHGGFSEEEDHIICSLYISIGSRWSIIAAQLPGRTDNDVKNYWNTKLKKKLLGRRRGSQSRLLNHDSNKVNGAITVDDTSLSALSTSTLERMQLHMRLQSLQYPFPLYKNPALWPKFMTQQTPNTTEGPNLTSCDLMQEQLNNSLNGFSENSDFNSTTDSPVKSTTPKLNRVEESNTNFNMIDSLQAELRELLDGKTGCFIGQEDHIREFDCFKDMDGVKESMIWWATEATDFVTESSSNSWDSGTVLQDQGTFQDYVMGYNEL